MTIVSERTDRVLRTTTQPRDFRPGPSLEDVAGGKGTLKEGHAGRGVRELQDILKEGGYLPKYGVDGLFGAETKQALAAWQRALDLPATGELDPQTLRKLREVQHSPLSVAGPQGLPRAQPANDIEQQRAVEFMRKKAATAAGEFERKGRWEKVIGLQNRNPDLAAGRKALEQVEAYANTLPAGSPKRQELQETIAKLRARYDSLAWAKPSEVDVHRGVEQAKALEARIQALANGQTPGPMPQSTPAYPYSYNPRSRWAR